MASVLIAGLGDIGQRLAVLLQRGGHEVHGIRRGEVAPAGVHLIRADLLGDLPPLPPVQYVYYILTPADSTDEGYRLAYVEGLKRLLGRLDRSCLRRLFFVSSTGVYAQDSGEWVDETSPARPEGFSGRRLREAEDVAWHSGIAATVVRFAGIYGPGRNRLWRWVESGKPVQADPPAWTNRIHSDDCAELLAFLLEKDVSGAEIADLYIGVDDHPVPQAEVLDGLAAIRGLPPVPHESRPGSGSNKRLSNARIKALGFGFRYSSWVDGYQDTK